MANLTYTPPWFLKNGLLQTLYIAWGATRHWEAIITEQEPPYQEQVFIGADNVPIFGWLAIPEQPRGTIIGTYGITGSLDNQWVLRVLGCKAFAQGYAVVLFDWRGHGKTGELSPNLTADGLYEGEDFVRIAAQAKAMGCPAPFWLTSFSLGGQLALWGIKASQDVDLCQDAGLLPTDIKGGAVICPSLDSNRSLSYLVKHPYGKYLERAIARELKNLARQAHQNHPDVIDPLAVERIDSIWAFDQELVIERLGFPSVEAYYQASSGLHLLPDLHKPTLIIYAADDPMFDPAIIPDLQTACDRNQALDLVLTKYGGHVGYISSKASQVRTGDCDPWWAWNRVLEWCDRRK